MTPARDPGLLDPTRAPWRDEHGSLNVHSFRDVTLVLQSDRVTSDTAQNIDIESTDPSAFFIWATDRRRLDGTPGRHDALRELLLPWLGARSAPARRVRFEAIATEVTAGLPATFDLYTDLGVPVVTRALCDLLGVSAEEGAWLVERAREQGALDEGAWPPPARPHIDAYFRELFARDDLTGMVAAMQEALADGRLHHPREAWAMIWGTVQAATLNVAATTAAAVGLLVQHGRWPIEEAALGTTVEEAVRLSMPFPVSLRYVIEDLELSDGTVARSGEVVTLWLGASGFDPTAPIDTSRAPLGEFDPHRDPNRHLGWSTGQHRCTGVALAREIIAVTVGVLGTAIPSLELAGPWQRYVGVEDGYLAAPVRVPGTAVPGTAVPGTAAVGTA